MNAHRKSNTLAAIALCALTLCAAPSSRGGTTIDAVNRYAWGANIGWIDWNQGDYGAVIGQSVCSGFIYSANVGWINLGNGRPANGSSYGNNSGTDFGVNVDSSGNLSGLAWGANIGWINFVASGNPAVDLITGKFSGYAWGANVGWINLNSGYGVTTYAIYPGTTLLVSKLQVLLPGETSDPGTPTGKTGTPTPQVAGVPFYIVVNAVDGTFQVVSSATPKVAISSSDGAAVLPANSTLASGTFTFTVTLNTLGTQTVTATDTATSNPLSLGLSAGVSVYGALVPGVNNWGTTEGQQLTVPVIKMLAGANSFTYTLSDGFVTAQGTVNITISSGSGQSKNLLSITMSGSCAVVDFLGIPGNSYVVQYASSLTGPWTDLSGAITADAATGVISYQDCKLDESKTKSAFDRVAARCARQRMELSTGGVAIYNGRREIMSNIVSAPRRQFFSDNWAGICPEALAAMTEANRGHATGYGDDGWTRQAADMIREIFETDCQVFFVFSGTGGNSLALASLCLSHQSVLCHEDAHVETGECGAPEFFSGGAKIRLLPGANGKLEPASVESAVNKRGDIHFPKPRVLSLTQATEAGTVYSPDELRDLCEAARRLGLRVHMDGARFANAVASLGVKPKEIAWRAGVDILCLGGTKNGMAVGEAIVFFDAALAREFDYRRKQAGQLASKMRFLSAPWIGMLREGAWLRHAARANAMARRLEDALGGLPEIKIAFPCQTNAVFAVMPPALIARLRAQGWQFSTHVAPGNCRLMCSWDTTESDVDALAEDIGKLSAETH